MRRALLTTVLLALLLVACGGDSDDTKPAGATTSTTAVGTATPGSINTNFTGEGSERFCGLARSFSERRDRLGDTDLTNIKPLVVEAESGLRDLVAAAPNEIRTDAQVVAAAFTSFMKALERVNYDATKLPPDAMSGLQKPEVQVSGQRLVSYSEKVCGITTTTTVP